MFFFLKKNHIKMHFQIANTDSSIVLFSRAFENADQPIFLKKLNFFLKIFFLYVLDCFNVLILKIIFLKKNIILIHFKMKNNRNYILKYAILFFFQAPIPRC